MHVIDLNSDLGEGCAHDDELMQVVSSCNIACGGHAGDADSMGRTIRLAIENGVAVGAHPSYPDRQGFGRNTLRLSSDELYKTVSAQGEALLGHAAALGARVSHLKPHGALYNDAAADPQLAATVARVTAELPGDCRLVGPPDSELQTAASDFGLTFVAEAFVDRAYNGDGSLVSRSADGAVYRDVDQMVAQAVSLVFEQAVTAVDGSRLPVAARTLCLHGDTPGAAAAARAVRDALEARGARIRPAGKLR